MNPKAEADAARKLAYRIAGALQVKLKGQIVGIRVEYLPICERLVIEYTLTDGGRVQSSTAYSQSYFEDTSKEHVRWLATQIYTQLKQRLDWLLRGNNAHSTYAGDRSERPVTDSIPRTGVVQNRRSTGCKRGRPATKPKDVSDPKFIHTEQVPASAIEGT